MIKNIMAYSEQLFDKENSIIESKEETQYWRLHNAKSLVLL